jgi:tetratricopeptide (TPR) repeat protein
MVTLGTYPNSLEAGLAKSLLESHNIVCCLADEGANAYGGAPIAMPIRLLVAEDQVDQARELLNEVAASLPDDFEPIAGNNAADNEDDANLQILQELRELRQRYWWTTVLIIAVLVLTIYLLSELPQRSISPWTKVSQAMRRYDYDAALSLAKAISAEYPNDYYGHEYLGDIYRAMDNLPNAEIEYSRAKELAPPQAIQAKLEYVQKRRGNGTRPAPTLSPWP